MIEVIKYLDNLLKLGDTIVVATSGGPDSMVLLDILCKYKDKLNLKIIVAHVNHNVRDESDDDERLVENYSGYQQLIFENMKITQVINKNFEMTARKIRYDYFEKIIKKYNASYLLTAHHGDDLIETILMRISRGSTLKGYKGISLETMKNGYTIIRPLLYLDKEDIIKYADLHNIKYAIDYTNNLDEHTRNRYRHNILPFLKSENKNIHLKYKQFSSELSMYDEFVENYLNKSNILSNNKIDIDKFNREDILIKVKVVERLLNNIYDGYLEVINKKHVNSIIDLIKNKKSNSKINLPNNYIGIINYDYFEIICNFKNTEIDLILDKNLEIDNKSFVFLKECDKKTNYVIRINSKEITLPLHIRSRKAKDKMSVKNLNGTKKVSDILTNEKLDYINRQRILLLTDDNDNILWIPGVKKSKFDKDKCEKCDIILEYILKRGDANE